MWVQFNHAELPRLAMEGWRITFAEDYPYRVAPADGLWRADVADTGIDWFELDLGIEVDGQRVPLLPVLVDLFERAPEDMTPAALEAFGDDPVYGTLPDGRLLPIPASRLKAMLGALYELFASDRIEESGTVRLSRAEATRLIALEAALPPELLAWRGGERLREMARRLGATSRSRSRRCPRASRRRCAPTRWTATRGSSSWARAASRACSPTTWGWARRSRRWPTSRPRRRPGG
jgi:hypothetical protein